MDDKYEIWLTENMWLLGVFYLILGIIIALYGVKLFPYIGASIVAIFTISVVCSLTLAFGWMEETWGCVLCIIFAFVLGIAIGMVMRRNIWLLIALTGLVGGFFTGVLIDSTIAVLSGWNTVWFYWIISCLMGAIGCLLSCCFGKGIVMVSTSGIGSYLFMRSWTLFFPGSYPSEESLIESKGADALEMDALFWMYVGIFIVSFIVSLTFQCNYSNKEKELDDHFAKQDKDEA